jgi:hypothetical protein
MRMHFKIYTVFRGKSYCGLAIQMFTDVGLWSMGSTPGVLSNLSRKKNYGNKKKNIQCILKNVRKKSNEKRKLMKKATKKILS